MAIIKRAGAILKKRGLKGVWQKGREFAAGKLLACIKPGADPRNANWHRYIRDLDRRLEVMWASPWKMELASTSVCNLQCVMCPHAFSHPRAGTHFDLKVLERLSGFLPGAGVFQLMGPGEPLISPAFWKIMEAISSRPSRKEALIEISSNGAAMTPHIVEKIIRSPLRAISISLDAATPETYKKIRGVDFNRTLGNIRNLLQRRRETAAGPHVMLNMTLMRENIAELPAFVDLARELGADSMQFWPLHDYGEAIYDDWQVERDGWKFNYREQMLGRDEADAAWANALIEEAVARAKKYGIPVVWPMDSQVKIMAPKAQPAKAPEADDEKSGVMAPRMVPPPVPNPDRQDLELDCVAPWEWMLTDTRGDVRPCCYIARTFGNLKEKTAWEIWNGPEYREMRRCLARGELPPQCRGAACKYARGGRYYLGAAETAGR